MSSPDGPNYMIAGIRVGTPAVTAIITAVVTLFATGVALVIADQLETANLILPETTAPALSDSGEASIYADSGSHTVKLSINGGAYEDLGAGSGGDLLADGTVPLTANWDAGAFEIRAETFESDVSTGTAPFAVASTTVVTNLNADLLDGESASAFQDADADLDTWAGLTPSANAQSLVTAADYAAMRGLLDLEAGTDFLSPAAIAAAYQPLDADLSTYAGITPSANVQSLLGAADYSAMRTQLSLVVGTNIQAYDAELAALAGLTSAADKGIQFTGAGTAGTFDLTTAGKALLDDATAAAQATTLGLGTGNSPEFTAVNIGHASNTTLARSGAGDLTIEGNAIYRAGGTDVPVTDGGTGLSSVTAYRLLLGGTTDTGALQFLPSEGNPGNVLKSNGNDMLPSWEDGVAPTAVQDGATSSGSIDYSGDGTRCMLIECWGAGGSGGKGRSGSAGGGGGGGGYTWRIVPYSAISWPLSFTVGTGGASQTSADTAGNQGGDTYVSVGGVEIRAYGGGGGGGTSTSGGNGGGGGGGELSKGGSASGSTRGASDYSVSGVTYAPGAGGNGGTTGTDGQVGLAGVGGGGGGSSDGAANANGAGGNSVFGGAGGGAGAEDSSPGPGAGGSSKILNVSGGAGANDANNAADGGIASGGGGSETGNSGAGGTGYIRFTRWRKQKHPRVLDMDFFDVLRKAG